MTTIIKIIIFILINVGSNVFQNTDKHAVTVKIEGLKSSEGKLLVGLYNSENGFLKASYMDAVVGIEANNSTVTFKDVPRGVYAVSFVHDKNDNGKLDTNFMGIPKEDYGCSNNAKGFMGPPKWKDAKFELKSENKSITISL